MSAQLQLRAHNNKCFLLTLEAHRSCDPVTVYVPGRRAAPGEPLDPGAR